MINLGGAIHIVTQITYLVDPCMPFDRCRAVPVTAYLRLARVTGVGQSAYRDAACTLGFMGSIDEVRLFNRALAPSEILNLYQTTP